MGTDVCSPLKPFLVDGDRAGFWQRNMRLASALSGDMMRINKDEEFFAQVLAELETFVSPS